MIDLKYLKITKSLVKKTNPIERFRFIHQVGNTFISTNGFHFLAIIDNDSNVNCDNIIDVHKIYSSDFDTKTEIGVVFNREEKEIPSINIETVRNQNFEALDIANNMQELITKATIELNKEATELWYLDMVEYYGVLKSLEALNIEWTCSYSVDKKSIKFVGSKNELTFEYYLILRTVDHQPS